MGMMNLQSLYRTLVTMAIISTVAILCWFSKTTFKMQHFQYQRNNIDTHESIKRKLLPQDFDIQSYISDVSMKHSFSQEDLVKRFNVSSDGSDVIVFLRIQKTGSSTLSRHLSDDVDLRPSCNCSEGIKRCTCLKKWTYNVLFRPTVHDGTCNLHAGYAQLLPCVGGMMDKRHNRHRKRRYLYMTNVRDPLRRYLSEWMHVRLWGQWGSSPKACQYPTASRIWVNVTLQQFMKCQTNPAINRQTHMLGLVHPSHQHKSKEIKDMELVKSAMDNLKNFAYFGITEHQELSQILFEETFNLHFIKGFETRPQRAENRTNNITDEERREILRMNALDLMFFQYAEDLFRLRILKLIERTHNVTLKERLEVLSRPLFKNKMTY